MNLVIAKNLENVSDILETQCQIRLVKHCRSWKAGAISQET